MAKNEYTNRTNIKEIQEAVKLICGSLDSENLSLWAKENEKLDFSSRARFINAVLSGLTFALKSQENYISGVQVKIKDAIESNNGSDTHESYLQGLMENITMNDITTSEFHPIMDLLKVEYKKSTGSEWKAYVKSDKNQLGKNLVTESRIKAMAMLEKNGVAFKKPDSVIALEKDGFDISQLDDEDLNDSYHDNDSFKSA